VNADQPWRTVQLGGLSWHVRSTALEQVKPVCANVEQAIAAAPRFYKNSRNVTVASVPGSPPLVVRRMNYGTFRHRFKDFFRPSRARRAFFRGLHLEQAGIPTPRMLAVAEQRRFRWPLRAWLISDQVPAAQTLVAWLRRRGENSHPVLERLAAVIARMHEHGFTHRDLKPSNILLDANLNPWLIDMDGVQFVGKVSLEQTARDLSVLAALLKKSPQLRPAALRFLLNYCKHRGLTSERRQIASLL